MLFFQHSGIISYFIINSTVNITSGFIKNLIFLLPRERIPTVCMISTNCIRKFLKFEKIF